MWAGKSSLIVGVVLVLSAGMAASSAGAETIYVEAGVGGSWIYKPTTTVGGTDGFCGNICVALF